MSNINSQDLAGLANFYGSVGHTLSPLWSYASSVLILLILMLVLIFFARYMGRGPFVGLVCAFYIGYALYAAFPYASYLPTAPATTALAARVALYFAFFVVGYIILRRIAASDFIEIGTMGLILTSFVTAGFIMVLAYQSFPVRSVYNFSATLNTLFAAKEWFFAWFAAPIIALFLFAR